MYPEIALILSFSNGIVTIDKQKDRIYSVTYSNRPHSLLKRLCLLMNNPSEGNELDHFVQFAKLWKAPVCETVTTSKGSRMSRISKSSISKSSISKDRISKQV